ncbi:GNAT family N-acetyltransferase [Peribacillus frigoritolerans]|uniref:GNAT family N-acetyltransferase n=1 Tax=Peribacillus frigoritolerans TaxID=450367 RepID=UPI00227F0CA6|nr:GNAT family N-acetyltransferase [Peribacillus frigoritolerans]MCY9006782.1 GNAT family N-acetyltransferase [Peribacillus frigoritolerans]
MTEEITEKAVTLYDLEWDTEYFGVTSAKAILNTPLSLNEWAELKTKFRDYQFISIVNLNSEPENAQKIGKDTSAFLADVNIQFVKKIKGPHEVQKNITVHQSLGRNDQVIKIADFQFSKFTEDPELAKRGGDQVYRKWLINSFNKSEKFYALSKDENGELNGFLLHSYSGNTCVIELIAVSQNVTKGGIGTSLFKAVENEAHLRGCGEIRVGTQMRNMGAINFYHKVGCKQVGCHQVHHLWNL